jgi:hypothetical protein
MNPLKKINEDAMINLVVKGEYKPLDFFLCPSSIKKYSSS